LAEMKDDLWAVLMAALKGYHWADRTVVQLAEMTDDN